MAASGYTPISLYYSTTASAVPTAGNLANGELALNIADMKLYAKNSAGTVTLLASNASTTGVDSLSFGSTGLTPSTATTGAITVAGTLATTNGGTGLTSFTANGVLYASSTSALTTGSALTFDGTTVSSPVVQSTNGTITTVLSYSGGNSTGVIGTTSNHSVEFRQNNTEGMRLTSTGLGIGTSSPNARLEANKTITFSGIDDFGQFVVKATSGATGNLLNFGVDNANGLSFIQSLNRGTDATALVLQRYGGNVGIGTSSPNFKAHISTGSTTSITQPTAGSYGLYVQQNTSGSVGGIYIQDGASNSGNSLFIGDNNGAARFVVDGDGNVGIGTSSPSTKLHAKGTGGTIATFERDASGTIAYFNRNAGSGNAGAIIGADSVAGYFAGGNSTSNMVYLDSVNNLAQFYTNGSERFRIGSSGQWGIGGANYGTSGQVLTSAGSGAAPTWATAASGAQAFVAFGSTGGY